MKKVFVIIVSLVLGGFVIAIRVLQKRADSHGSDHSRENWTTAILLLMTWGTPFFLLFIRNDRKKKTEKTSD
ncbi:MAG: hypothetical protein ABJB86_13590 [Bacteroidota bacterium]